jgi:thioredoxin reductase
MYDVLIVGGGPAGLSAALWLGRCRRRVLVCDAGRPRNIAAQEAHGYLTRDAIHPVEFLRLGREDLVRYGVELRQLKVEHAQAAERGFTAALADGTEVHGRKLLLATGVVDEIPSVPGMAEYYGRGVFHCPYCDGWEVRDLPLVAFGHGKSALGLALSLKTWSKDITICTHGPANLTATDRQRLRDSGLVLRAERIGQLEGSERGLERIIFETGQALTCRALFFNTGQLQRSDLFKSLGCRTRRDGAAWTDHRQRTSVPGLFLAGDASRDVQFLIVAAAEGAKAAVAINRELQDEDRGERRPRRQSAEAVEPAGTFG